MRDKKKIRNGEGGPEKSNHMSFSGKGVEDEYFNFHSLVTVLSSFFVAGHAGLAGDTDVQGHLPADRAASVPGSVPGGRHSSWGTFSFFRFFLILFFLPYLF